MTAPASIHPRTVDDLLPAARELRDRLGEIPSRNRLMRDFRVGAPKADELRARLIAEHVQAFTELTAEPAEPAADPWEYAEPLGPDPAEPTPDTRVRVDAEPEPEATETTDRVETLRTAMILRGALLPPPDTHPNATGSEPASTPPASDASPQVAVDGHPGTPTPAKPRKPLPVWPVWLLMLPAFVAVWAGWVELGKLTGFGPVDLLPGFTRDGQPLLTLDTAITLPIGMETYAGYALYIWLSGRTTRKARIFAMASALIALTLGGGAQITYHLLTTPDTGAPWPITTVVACLPVAVLGMGAALAHLVREGD